MVPTAAVSDRYFFHPDARYFTVGKIGREPREDDARRNVMDLAEVGHWLAPNSAYEP